ncbi:uncharacterized protein N7500_004123 [Penicillium coprophilum]|uniref:uncharacterized protein n=1 Tax=Penicillium coprophilum TaxID=36646 RepID=UPI00238C775E|nr:uncharacterized protein N7500_004123 [Penicillium coprophilum]KAJ5171340.1 hypothetical protein N7500_004123 [Penicillium coprophilum]
MTGKHMSATHVADLNTHFIGNCGQHGITAATALYLCQMYDSPLRDIYENHNTIWHHRIYSRWGARIALIQL